MRTRTEASRADLFMADLLGTRRTSHVRTAIAPLDAEETLWVEAVGRLPDRYQAIYGFAQLAEQSLDEDTIGELTFDLLEADDQAGLEEFIKKLTRTVTKAARDVARTGVGTAITKTVTDVGRTKIARQIAKAAKDIEKGVGKVGAAVPMLGTITKLASRGSPLGLLARSTYGALSAALRGQNVFMGALDGLSGTPLFAAAVKIGGAAIRGENLVAAAKMAAKAGIADVREAVRFAAMVAPFVPGIGTGVGAALGAADALANGQPITQALIAGVRGAIPGGAIAQAAFDTAAQLVQGKRLDQALLTAARNRLPPGPAQAAFDTGLALAQGKNAQDAVLHGGAQLLPASPYTADALSFAKRAMRGENLGQAALSTAGQAVLHRVQQQGNDLVATVQGRAAAAVQARVAGGVSAVPAVPAPAKPAVPAVPVTLDRMIRASNRDESRNATAFVAGLAGRASATGAVRATGYVSTPPR
jgi:hypothetical protein